MPADLPLQKALFSLLTGDATLTGLVTGVYDHVPDNTPEPYVVIGDDDIDEWATMGTNGGNAEVTIHTWTTGSELAPCKTIMARIYDLVHKASLSVSGYNTAGCLSEFSATFKEADNRTMHGVQRFRVWLREQ